MNNDILFVNTTELTKELHLLANKDVLVVTDTNVWRIYENLFRAWIGRDFSLFILPAGESHKNFSQLERALEFFLEKSPTRQSVLLAFGGGVVSDFGGLVAALLLRGISWWAIPTTVIGQVDASIGGKVGINSHWGKNLVGQFHFPQKVLIDTKFLSTLSESERASGKGEILKYAFLDEHIYEQVMMKRELEELIPACVALKKQIVTEDPFEKDARVFLNLGHTLGHALEKELALPHGVAVALGLKLILELFTQDQKKKLLQDFEQLGVNLGLGLDFSSLSRISVERMLDLVFHDKKREEKNILRVVSLLDVGRPVLLNFTQEEVQQKLSTVLGLQ